MMAKLVSYSGSSSSSDEESPPNKKFKENYSLPDSIKTMFSECDYVDSQDEHEGRVRGFAHVRGNWPTHVYIPVKFHDDFKTLIMSFHQKLIHRLSSFSDCPLIIHTFDTCDGDLHISLSRTVPLQYHWINPITTSLQNYIEKHEKFLISFAELVFYSNDDKTRSFIGLSVHQGHSKLSSIVDKVDTLFEQFKLPKFYEERSFHVSLYWTLGDILPKLTQSMINNLKKCWSEELSKYDCLQDLSLLVACVNCKIGNKMFVYKLD